ncbi:MAG TPA: serine/threonine-protein kinase [Polyangiaceae bacterium]
MSSGPDSRLVALRDKLTGMVLQGSQNVSFHLRDRIGEGGQGWVFTANWDEPGGFVVIVKVLRPDAVNADALRRFQREAEVLRMLSTRGAPNPYIVRFFDHAIATMNSPVDGEKLVLPFTVLEYVNGPTLEQVLDTTRGRGLGVERVRRILKQVSQALTLVHKQKIVHRDLKPSNILLANEAGAEVAKVTDFGLVKLVEMNMQRTTTLAGASLGYAPPEQYEQGNERVSARTDVFSLAAIAYEMLSGKFAFPFRDGENPLLIVTRIMNGPRPELAKTMDSLSPELAGKIGIVERLDNELKKALAADLNDRHASVDDFWKAIEPLLRNATEGSLRPPSSAAPSSELAFLETIPAYGDAAQKLIAQLPDRMETGASASQRAPAPASVHVRGSDPNPVSPTSWIWRVATRPLGPNIVRSASFAPDGSTVVGIGPGGLARWDRGAWIGITLPPNVDARQVRNIRRLRGGDIVLVGDGGLAVRIAPSGKLEAWNLPQRDINLFGSYVDERAGIALFVGERPHRAAAIGRGPAPPTTIGSVVQLTDGRVTFAADVAGTTRLRALTRILGGSYVACGEAGAIARIEGGTADLVRNVCAGHLNAIEALSDGGAVTVGAGGHALYLSPRLEAQLEAVQTTRDLQSVAVGDDGCAWAGAAQARLLRRTGESWNRMSGEFGLASSVIAVWAGARMVRAVCDDGAVIEGQAS